MKLKQFIYPLLLCVAALLAGCSGNELSPADFGETPTQSLTVTVRDNSGYASSDNGTQTRATEDGYHTMFAKDDKIGLYAVKGGVIQTDCDNLCLTFDGTNWKLPDGKELTYNIKDIAFYAYYPYQSALTGTLVPSASNADGFFANVITNWTPATDQSTPKKYTDCDLMTGSGEVGEKQDGKYPLTITLSHKMALVVICLPDVKYIFTNDPHIPDYILASSTDPVFNRFTPCDMTGGTYRYLVTPAQSSLILQGSYTNAESKTMEWEVVADINAGNYKEFDVDGGINITQYKLEVGDYYMKDGSLRKETTDNGNVIGVVYQVGANDNKVVSLVEGNGKWSTENVNTGATGSSDGKVNTDKILTDKKDAIKDKYPIFQACLELRQNTGNNGWYIPVYTEAKDVLQGDLRISINEKIKGKGTEIEKPADKTGQFWTSTEYDDGGARFMISANAGVESKAKEHKVRFILKF